MKILAIRGKNLASLEGEFEIDFTAEPLKSAGIFVITGSTGSGKSTLLDALCLALFDDTPRINRAAENNIQVPDVKDRTVNQKDSRNILRRGTADGYAEVDFVSLGGEIFRSRWSVRRSRMKTGGALQNTELRLLNLTANREEQGRKTDLLARIAALTGLTFDQFTRAVLLAQGDFATFLRATQKEKAELLEKLTGTGIYSRISVAIYEKSKNAGQELNLLRERIRDVELLADEDLEALSREKQTLTHEAEALKKKRTELNAKIQWLAEESLLTDAVEEAQQQLAHAIQAIEEAGQRYHYLSQVDGVQEIRDEFNELKTSAGLLAESRNNLAEQEKLRNANASMLEQSILDVALCEKDLRRHNEIFERIEPEIKQARELDIRIEGIVNQAEEARKEYNQAEERKVKLERSVAQTQASANAAKENMAHADAWFKRHEPYREIIPRVDLIINLLDDAAAAKKQEAAAQETRAASEALLQDETRKLELLNKESERLSNLLPAGIASLRAKLEEGKPCPVCGSDHHPYRSIIAGESLEETELNAARKNVAGKITALSGRTESLRNENIRLASVMGNYARQAEEAMSRLDGFLAAMPGWKTAYEQGNLSDRLRRLAAAWNENELILSKAHEQAATFRTSIRLAGEQLLEAEETCRAKEEKYSLVKNVLTALQEKRSGIFGGKAAGEVEKHHILKRKSLSETLAGLNEEKNKRLAAKEKQEGMINQLSQEISRLSARCASLQETVDTWIRCRGKGITSGHLAALLSEDNAWIQAEREQLNRLSRNKTSAWAAWDERKKILGNHRLAENRPAEGESKELLQQILAATQDALQRNTSRTMEIEIALANHDKGRKRVALFEKELNEKAVLSGNWKQLNELFGSADGAKFKVLAQGYTLDTLLAYANRHLGELSGRYEIQRVPDTLALQVADLDMLGEVRTVHSLSGGESFLISLSLALGLSSLSSNRMKVESLFIDEGFGSLDADALRMAIDALEGLQTQGRKIGVISHLTEMTERISTQVRIIRTVNGRSRIEIRG
jgi:exonuclease SbcC